MNELTTNQPYYWAAIPLLVTSFISDSIRASVESRQRHRAANPKPEYSIRGPTISFNALCLITGIAMLGFADQDVVRYIGVFLATGAYASNWPALNAYFSNNITGLDFPHPRYAKKYIYLHTDIHAQSMETCRHRGRRFCMQRLWRCCGQLSLPAK